MNRELMEPPPDQCEVKGLILSFILISLFAADETSSKPLYFSRWRRKIQVAGDPQGLS
jgi:hypothetical protein